MLQWKVATEISLMSFPVEEKFIVAAEQELGRPLPEPLRSRLGRANGGEIEIEGDVWTLHPIPDNSDRKRVSRTANNILRETDMARSWSGFPSTAISIAEDGTGDRMVLREGSNVIERWRHDSRDCLAVKIKW
jgi:hypothetical protein